MREEDYEYAGLDYLQSIRYYPAFKEINGEYFVHLKNARRAVLLQAKKSEEYTKKQILEKFSQYTLRSLKRRKETGKEFEISKLINEIFQKEIEEKTKDMVEEIINNLENRFATVKTDGSFVFLIWPYNWNAFKKTHGFLEGNPRHIFPCETQQFGNYKLVELKEVGK